MKTEFVHNKNRAYGFSTRALATLLCFVMLLTAVGAGTMMTAFAVNGSTTPATVTDTAQQVIDIAASADAGAGIAEPDAADDTDDDVVIPTITKKVADIAQTGGKVDLAETGKTFEGNQRVYFVNTNNWSSVYIQFYYSNGSRGWQQMTQISGTGVYYHTFGSDGWDCNWFSFVAANGNWDGTATQSGWVDKYFAWSPNGSSWYMNWDSDITHVNGEAKVVSMIRTTGNYSETANSNCKATISAGNIGSTATSTSTSSGTTGSSATATCYPAYGATVSYSAVASGDYVFKGFSTTKSTSSSVPSGTSTTYSNKTNVGHYGKDDNLPTVYAYFEKKPSYTATITSDGGTVGTEKSGIAHISTTSSEGTATTVTTTSGTTVNVYTHQKSGYIPTVSVNSGAVSVTKVSNTKYSFSMPAGAANVTVTYAPATYKTVKVYAGTGGTVTVTYNNKTAATVSSGENATVYVYEGDSITLRATAASGYTFNRWKKNLSDNYSTANPKTETIDNDTVYVARFNGTVTSGWLYSGTAAAERTEVSPTSGLSAFSTSNTNYGAFRFMYGTTDTGLNTALTPSYYAQPSDGGYPYWAEITSAMNGTTGNFFIGLCNYSNKGNLVGNKSEEINDSASDKTITDTAGNTLFKLQLKQNNDVSSSAKYILIYSVDWNRVSAIGIKAYDNSKSTGSNNNHGNKVDYQIYYKAKTGDTNDTSYTPSVTYYAKDSAFVGTTDNPYFEADTTVTAVTDKVTRTTYSSSYDYESGKALKGTNITVSTTISGLVKKTSDNSTYANDTVYAADKYYIVGYSFNGITPQILQPVAASGNTSTYTCTYKIPEDMTENYLEITPIYWLKDSSNCCTFYVNGFEDLTKKQPDWGNTLYIYPFYTTTSSKYNGKNPGFGVYPGQPIVNNGGLLYTQIPLTEDGVAGGKTIKGVTINNGQNDSIHGSNSFCGFVNEHRQTYDYDDFYKIANEKKYKADGTTKNLESIFFTFKYFAESSTKQHRSYSTTSTTTNGYESRYNDTLVDSRLGNSSSTHNNYVSTTNLNNYASGSNGWERLTDPLGNQVDIYGNKVTDTTQTPLKVISMGYENNNAGKFATEWSIYHFNTSTSRYDLVYDSSSKALSSTTPTIVYNSSIVPSALVLNNANNFSKYPGLDGDLSIVNYKDMYSSLASYAGLPVEICYEHEAKDYDNSKAYRSDGRWNYTTVDDYVQSDIMIEYTDKNGNTQFDTFGSGSHVGTNTGCSAYFLNDDYSGATVSNNETISELDADRYHYTAVASGNYEFIGWDRINRGDTDGTSRTSISTNLSDYTKRSQNSTFIAKFKYVATGSMTVAHNVATSGTGTAYIGVYLVDSDNNEISTIAGATNTSSVTIDKSVITSDNATAGNKLMIVLRTVPTGENTFSTYTCTRVDGNDSSANTTSSNYYTSGANLTNETIIYVPFNGGIFNSGNQITKALTYTSTLSGANYNYNVKYYYTSRYYGEQAFTQTGTLNSTQTALGESSAVIEGTVNQADKTLKTSFLTRIKPHESNFNKSISWNFESGVTQYCTYNSSSNTYTINVVVRNAAVTETVNRTGYFNVPYELDTTDSKKYKEYTLNNDGVSYGLASADNSFQVTVSYDEYFKNNSDETITAPAILLANADGSGTKKYFQYWQIETVGATNQGARKVIGKCYYPAFNYRALDNYYLTAVYTENADENYSALYADSEAEATSISYIGTSRNHWNSVNVATASGTNDTTGKGNGPANAGDILYNDFILSFKPANDKLIKDIDGAEYGIIIQRMTEVPLTNGIVTATIADYETANKGTEDAAHAAALALATNGTKTSGFAQNIKRLSLDYEANNKNRMHYVYEVSNSTTGSAIYLFRAYSYMKYDGNTVVSEKPAYFYMRDVAIQ